MTHRVCLTLAVFASVAPAAHAQPAPRALTIAQAVDEAIASNLSLRAQKTELDAVRAGELTAGLRPNPILTGDADGLDWLGTGFNEINGAGPQQYAVRVDVPVERGQKRQRRLDLARFASRVAEAQYDDAVRRVKLDAMLAAIDLIEAKAKLTLARDNLSMLERLVELNSRRLASGAIPPLEVTRSRVAMLQYRGSVRTAELAVAEARLKLLPLLGEPSDAQPIDISDALAVTPDVAEPDLSSLQEAARAARPDLQALVTDQARGLADLRLQLAQGKVDYTAGAEYRRQQGVNAKGNLVGLFLSVPLPIFSRNQGEIARAEAENAKAAQSLAALQIDVAAEVASAYDEFESSREQLVEIERDLLQPTVDARAGTTYVYQAGATSLLDVLDAQRAFNDTMDTYYSAQANYRRAQVRLALVVGKDASQ